MPRNTPDQKARQFRRGQRSIPARQINLLVDAVNKPLVGVNQITQPGTTARGTSLRRLIFISMDDDFIVCTTPAGYAAGEPYDPEINVAKPYLIRRTPFDAGSRGGISYTYTSDTERTADDGVEEITEVVTPQFVVGDEIIVSKVSGGTGVEIPGDPATPVTLLDINNDARTWAEVPI